MSNKRAQLANFMSSHLEEAITKYTPDLKIYPDAKVVKIGGQSITDRGRKAVFPILDELVAAKTDKGYKIIVSTGGGTRARHTYQVAMDLDLPSGILASLGESIPKQNARMLQMLLAKHGGILTEPDEFAKIPLFLHMNCMPIMPGMPPYSYWEDVPDSGSIPMNRTDAGAYFLGESLGVQSVLYIKDEEGLFTKDPKKGDGKFIGEIQVDDLIAMDLEDLIVERVVLGYLKKSQHLEYIQIVNGLVPGNVTRALDGEKIGTVIYK